MAICACEPYVEGNGVYREEERTVGAFEGVHVEDGIVATVTSHAPDFKVVVTGDSNVLQYIRTQVQDETIMGQSRPVLHVWVDLTGYSSTNPSAVVVQAPDVVYALAKKDARVDVIEASTPIFAVRVENGGDVSLVGPHDLDPLGDPAGDAIDVVAANGTVDASRYVTIDPTEAATVEISANAYVRLHADGEVVGTAASGSRLYNFGSGTCDGVGVSGGATVECPGPGP